MTTISIITGSMPTVPVDITSTGYLTTNYTGGSFVMLDFSADGINWQSAGATVTFLGDVPSYGWEPDEDGGTVLLEVNVVPTAAGTATMYMRAAEVGEAYGPTFATTITAYTPVVNFQEIQLQVSTTATGPWAVLSGNSVSTTTLSDGGVAICYSSSNRYVRIRGTQVIDTGYSTGSVRVLAFNSQGVYQWRALAGSQVGALFPIVADEHGIFVVVASGSTSQTYVSASGTSMSVPSAAGARVWNVAKMTNAGQWVSYAKVIWTTSTTTFFPDSRSIKARAGRLAIGTMIDAGAGTLTFGANSLVSTYPAYATVNFRPAFIVLDTVTLNGVFGGFLSPNTLQSAADVDIAPDGAVAVMAIQGNSGSTREVRVFQYSALGALVNSATILTPNRYPFAQPSIAISDTHMVFGTERSSASDGLLWSGAGGTLTIPANTLGRVLWSIDRSTGLTAWKTFEATPTLTASQISPQDMHYSDNKQVVFYSISDKKFTAVDKNTGVKLWEANAVAGATPSGLFGGIAVDETGVSFSVYTNSAAATSTLVDAVSTISLAATTTSHYLVSLSDAGRWSQRQGSTSTPAGPPDPPESENWPASIFQDNPFYATVTGFDPEDTGGYATLEIWNPSTKAWVADPAELTYSGKGTLSITNTAHLISEGVGASFLPVESWYGTLRVLARWSILDPDTTVRTSAAKRFITVYNNTPEKVTEITGEMPDCDEDTFSQGVMTAVDPDKTGTYTWWLANIGTPKTAIGQTIAVWDDGETAGTVSVISQDNALRQATVRFTPNANWHGSVSFDIAVDNGSGAGLSSWETLSVTVNPIPDAPGAPTPVLIQDIDEDETLEQVFTWTDPDWDPESPSGSYTVQFALDVPEYEWQSIEVGEAFNLEDVVLRVLSVNGDALNAMVRIEPAPNFNGTYSFRMRLLDTAGTGEPLTGAASVISGVVISFEDAPSRITPTTMPRIRSGQSTEGFFTTIDPDTEDSTWTFAIANSKLGPWGTAVTIPGIGELTLIDDDITNKTAVVRMDANGGQEGRYQFWMKVTDSAGLTSFPTLITGYVTGAQVGAFLQRLNRGAMASTVEMVCPLISVSRLEITEALDGPGSATCVVAADEMRRRAADLGLSVAELLAPSSVELVVAIGAQPVWVGPVSSHEYDISSDGTLNIYANGLPAYFESMVLAHTDPLQKVSYVADDQSEIVWDIIDDIQTLPYSSLALTNNTVPCGTATTIEWNATTTVAEALRDLRQQLNAAEVWIEADRSVYSSALRGGDKRNLVRLSEGNCTAIVRSTSADDIITHAIVIGSTTHHGSFEDNTAMAKYGRITQVFEVPNLNTATSCELLATQIVERMSQPVEVYSVLFDANPLRPFGVTDINVGDVITLSFEDITLGYVRTDVRVINRSVDLVANTVDSYQVRLDLETAVYVDGVLQGSRARHVPEVFEQLYEALYIA